MFLEVITPDEKIFEGEIKSVKIPGTKGSFEILKNHAPIISTLGEGTIRIIDKNNKEHRFQTGGGVLENRENKIIILIESA